jgi:hypothetical protein
VWGKEQEMEEKERGHVERERDEEEEGRRDKGWERWEEATAISPALCPVTKQLPLFHHGCCGCR